jgi:hypothetical protein
MVLLLLQIIWACQLAAREWKQDRSQRQLQLAAALAKQVYMRCHLLHLWHIALDAASRHRNCRDSTALGCYAAAAARTLPHVLLQPLLELLHCRLLTLPPVSDVHLPNFAAAPAATTLLQVRLPQHCALLPPLPACGPFCYCWGRPAAAAAAAGGGGAPASTYRAHPLALLLLLQLLPLLLSCLTCERGVLLHQPILNVL